MSADPDSTLLEGYRKKLKRLRDLLIGEKISPDIVDSINLFIQEIDAEIEKRGGGEKKVPDS